LVTVLSGEAETEAVGLGTPEHLLYFIENAFANLR
jgi:hypothetical protein